MINSIRKLLAQCTPAQQRQIFTELRETLGPHPFELRMNAKAEVIFEALERASDLTLRGIRGIIGEAAFVLEVIPKLTRWHNVPFSGDHPYDAVLRDANGDVRVQCKMQRRERGLPLIRKGFPIVEVQRTRTGKKKGQATRPYRVGEFDILAVCMEPSKGQWDSFMYAPEPWLYRRQMDPKLIDIMQPVSLTPDDVWTNDFDVAVRRLRSKQPRPGDRRLPAAARTKRRQKRSQKASR